MGVGASESLSLPNRGPERGLVTGFANSVLIEPFVETPRYTGAVYRASGWTHVGTTQGIRRTAACPDVARPCSRRVNPSASVRSTGPLALIDLRGHEPIRIGAPSAIAHDGNHAAGGALSAAVHATVPEAEGRVEVLAPW